eukprot:2468103-Alexandrium_andersonii.AAC.1
MGGRSPTQSWPTLTTASHRPVFLSQSNCSAPVAKAWRKRLFEAAGDAPEVPYSKGPGRRQAAAHQD